MIYISIHPLHDLALTWLDLVAPRQLASCLAQCPTLWWGWFMKADMGLSHEINLTYLSAFHTLFTGE